LIGFGWNGGGILLDPSVQSPKLIAVWTKLEPLPLVVNAPAPNIEDEEEIFLKTIIPGRKTTEIYFGGTS
jgi:hypothetical protein